jgi:hemerythrin-like domain-containing protein
MLLVQELRREHELIERVLGSLRTYVARRVAAAHPEPDASAENRRTTSATEPGEAPTTASNDAPSSDTPRFLRFFRLYAGHYHHAREEDTLFVALQHEAELPADRGPIALMLADHRRFAALLDELEKLLAVEHPDAETAARLQARTTEYAHGLWHHIDAENSVLLPESESRLLKVGVRELPSRPPTAEESAARDEGVALLERYPETSDMDAFRGDGCVACPAFGRECEGFEREWWNEHEWAELEDRGSSD